MRFVLVQRTAWRVSESWNSVGLRATAAHTVIVEPHFVPTTHAFTRADLLAGTATHSAGRCHRTPMRWSAACSSRRLSWEPRTHC